MMRAVLLSIVLLASFTTSAFAWGVKGHEAIAEIAWRQLSLVARAEAARLIGDHDAFLKASVWADEVRRQRPNTATWHFVDIPLDGGSYNAARDCPMDDCVVARIDGFTKVLRDKGVADPLRAEALKWVIHFVGDVHQPLHAADDHDRGGNDVWVRIAGKTDRLHSWWDSGLLDRLGNTSSEIANILQDSTGDTSGSPTEWANQSFKVARDFIYKRTRGKNEKATPILLPESYVTEAMPIVERQMRDAGARLAKLLNSELR